MSFQKRRINLTFQLGEGSFGTDGFNTVKVEGLRILASINKAGGPSMGTAVLEVYGMALELMNKLSTQGQLYQLQTRNTVIVEAGTDEGGIATVFVGTITAALVQFETAPDVPLHVEAHTGLLEAVQTARPSSFTGPTDIATIMSGLAATAGLHFENNGVTGQLANPYFSGSVWDQIKACGEASGIGYVIDDITLAIWPRGGSRGGLVPLISPDTGMVLSPSYTSKGIHVKTEFNKDIGYGAQVEVQCNQPPANGRWIVSMLNHDLESEAPNGSWFSEVETVRPGLLVVA